MNLAFPLLAFATAFAVAARAADAPLLTDVRVKEIAARTYLCAKKELKLPEMAEFAPAAITRLMKTATELKLSQGGPVIFTYLGFYGDPTQTFTAEIGVPIPKGEAVPANDDHYVREAAKFKCAAAIFQGPLNKIGEAWQTFAGSAIAKGEPTGESRELYLYFEAVDSPNNIVELQMGLK